MPIQQGYDPTQPIGQPYGRSGPANLPGQPTSPLNSGPQSPFSSGGSTLPLSGGGFTSQQQSEIQNAFSAAGIWDTIQNIGGDVWGAISKILPKNADGSVNWGAIGSDVVKWVRDNKDTIIQGLNAYNSYERSQKSDKYAQQALDAATKEYAGKQPLRDAGQAGMLNPQANTPNLTALGSQGQNATSSRAPMPLPLTTGNLQNAQSMANGPQSTNPFTRTLPIAPLPPAPPPMPPSVAPPVGALPMRPIAPPSHPSDVGPIAAPTTLPIAPPNLDVKSRIVTRPNDVMDAISSANQAMRNIRA